MFYSLLANSTASNRIRISQKPEGWKKMAKSKFAVGMHLLKTQQIASNGNFITINVDFVNEKTGVCAES